MGIIKTSVILTLLFLPVVVSAQVKPKQPKWIECGLTYGADTTETTYYLKGKDSIGYEIMTDNCNCELWQELSIERKLHSCKGLKRHYITTNLYSWEKTVTLVKGKAISETKPSWVSTMGVSSTIDGSYEINGKFIQPAKLFYKNEVITISKF